MLEPCNKCMGLYVNLTISFKLSYVLHFTSGCKNILLLYMYNRGMSEGRKKYPFREAFSRVKDLRSQLPGVPVIALTASVLLKERQKLIKASGMISPVIVDASPNKENKILDFLEMKESYSGSNLKWVADLISTHGRETPQTIIFLQDIQQHLLCFKLFAHNFAWKNSCRL